MPRRLLSQNAREALLQVPDDLNDWVRLSLLTPEDHALIRTRLEGGGAVPPALVDWLGEQIDVDPNAVQNSAQHPITHCEHARVAMDHLDLTPFSSDHMDRAAAIATEAALATDHGARIVAILIETLRNQKRVLPSLDMLERLAIKGRARARRESAIAICDRLTDGQRATLRDLLETDPTLGRSRLTWLRRYPLSVSPASLNGIIARLDSLRGLDLPADRGGGLHPQRLSKFAREGAAAPISTLRGFGERRCLATLAAQMMELSATLTDEAIAMFARLSGKLFTSSQNSREKTWSTGKARAGKLLLIFGDTLDTMQRAVEDGQDPFAVLDAEVGWETLLGHREDSTAFGALATHDPLVLASTRYSYMRKFAPGFLETFEFRTLEGGADLKAAIALLRDMKQSGKRKLPADPPMPFPAKRWRDRVFKDGPPNRRVYETAVIATLRDRLRAGDVWVQGSRDYRRLDSDLMPRAQAEQTLREDGFETNFNTWLATTRSRLDTRLDQVDGALKRGELPGVRMERNRLKITPHDAVTPAAAERLDRAIDAVMPRIRITDLLGEVNARTGFLDAFTDLRSGRHQSGAGAHGPCLKPDQPCPTGLGPHLAPPGQDLLGCPRTDHRCPPRSALCPKLG